MEMDPCNYALQQLRHLERERHNIDIKYEQDRMTTQENCKLDVQHQDITQHWKFIQNESFKGICVHNQTLANNNLLIGPHDHA